MGSKVSPNPKCWQSFRFTSHSFSHSWNSACVIPFWSLRNLSDRNAALSYCSVYQSSFCGSRNSRRQGVKRACRAQFDEPNNEIMMNLIQEVANNLDESEDEDDGEEDVNKTNYGVSENTQNRDGNKSLERGPKEQFRTKNPEPLEPALLGIWPDPPYWPERKKILRLAIQMRKSIPLDIPFSMQIIKKRLQLERNFNKASKRTYCSVKKTFSSMLFIIHELQNYALQIRESLYCEDLQGVMAKLRKEMDASFVWLFQQVFWKTPCLMVYMMVLLANFSVFSMSNNTVLAAVTPSSIITGLRSLTDGKNNQHSEVEVDADHDENGTKELTEEEEMLSSMLREGLGAEVPGHKTLKQSLTPVSPKTKGDEHAQHARTQLCYKKNLSRTPNNSLLLSNYAQFLYTVLHDHDEAEEYFRRSLLAEPPDGEAYCRYADFLWHARKDLWEAELRYMEAVQADPGNPYHQGKYVYFLWSTDGEDTCYPLELFDREFL